MPWSRTWTSPRRWRRSRGSRGMRTVDRWSPCSTAPTKSVRSALLIEHCRGVNVGSVPCSGLSFVAQPDAGRRLLGRGDGARQVRQLRHRRPRAVRPRDGSVRATQPDRLIRVARHGCRHGDEASSAAPSRSRDDDRDRSLAVGSAAQPDGGVHVLLAVALLHVPLPPDSGWRSEHVAHLRPAGGGVRRSGRRRLPVRGGRDR